MHFLTRHGRTAFRSFLRQSAPYRVRRHGRVRTAGGTQATVRLRYGSCRKVAFSSSAQASSSGARHGNAASVVSGDATSSARTNSTCVTWMPIRAKPTGRPRHSRVARAPAGRCPRRVQCRDDRGLDDAHGGVGRTARRRHREAPGQAQPDFVMNRCSCSTLPDAPIGPATTRLRVAPADRPTPRGGGERPGRPGPRRQGAVPERAASTTSGIAGEPGIPRGGHRSPRHWR